MIAFIAGAAVGGVVVAVAVIVWFLSSVNVWGP